MTSTDSTADRPTSSTVRGLLDWTRVVVGTLARSVVVTLLGLALWAAAPAAIGWMPTTVMSGSMEPRLSPGDVVVSRPVPAGQVRAGRVLLADDPDQTGHLRMHRYVQEGPDDTIITKGDANPRTDSSPIDRSAVHGVGYLRIPYVASPVLWLRTGEWARVVLAGAGLAGVLALCAVDRSLRRRSDVEPDAGDGTDGADGPASSDDDTGTDGGDGRGRRAPRGRGGREARHRAATGLPADRPAPGTGVVLGGVAHPGRRSARLRDGRRRRVRRVRWHGGTAAVVTVAVVVALLPGAAVAAPWPTRTTNPGVSVAALRPTVLSAFSCTTRTSGLGAKTAVVSWIATGGDAPVRTELLSGSTVVASVPGTTASTTGTAQSITLSGGGGLSLGSTTALSLRADYGTNWVVAGPGTVTVRTFTILGIGSAAECVP